MVPEAATRRGGVVSTELQLRGSAMTEPLNAFPGRYWHMMEDGRIQCDLCPRFCRLHDGQRAFCFVRAREGDQIVSTTYCQSSGFCVDPIEKKPLYHSLPGTSVLSFGTGGCNLGCKYCQNWTISKAQEFDVLATRAGPARLLERRLYLQRSHDLPRIRDRYRHRLPGPRHQERRRQRRLCLPGAAR